MQHSPYFLEVWRDPKGVLPRGASLGTSTEEVKAKEGADFYESDEIPYFLSYYFPLEPEAETLYNVIYYFNKEKTVTGITLSLAYDTSLFGNVDEKKMVDLQQEILEFLERKLGTPEVEERNSKRAGNERLSTWTDREKAMRITAVQYPDARREVKHSLRLDFELIHPE